MLLRIDPLAAEPLFEQIAFQVKAAVARGELEASDRIPSVRELAKDLAINPNTVARAYLELERAGLVNKRHGSGTYVSDGGSPLKRAERLKLLTHHSDALLAEARHLEIELDELIDLIRQRSKIMQPQEEK